MLSIKAYLGSTNIVGSYLGSQRLNLGIDINAPRLNGVSDTQVLQNSDFTPMLGVTAVDDRDGNLTSKIVITGAFDILTAGDYTLTYRVSDSSGNTTTATRHITVVGVDTIAPVFSGITDVTIDQFTAFDLRANVTAVDNIDGDITPQITYSGELDINSPGVYDITYTISDASGNTATAVRHITVRYKDITPPVISGAAEVSINEYTTFNPLAGVTATDSDDGDVIANLTVSGTVDTNTPGTYTLTYCCTDSKGNSTTVIRHVTVIYVDTVAPVFSGLTSVSITVGGTFDPLSGVTATDNTDGNVTARITCTGTYDVNTAGTYTLTYHCTDNAGNTATATRTLQVTAAVGPALNTLPDGTADTQSGNTITRNVGVKTFDGSADENWVQYAAWNSTSGTYTYTYRIEESTCKLGLAEGTTHVKTDSATIVGSNTTAMVATKTTRGAAIKDINNAQYVLVPNLCVRVLAADISPTNLTGFRTYLTSHPINFMFPLATPYTETI